MEILKAVIRLDDLHLSRNPDAFEIRSSDVEGAGMACFATRDLQPSELVLRVEEAVANVVVSQFRKEVCAWCYSYDFGSILKFKAVTGKGRGIAWFCRRMCHDKWMERLGHVGWEAVSAFEEGLSRIKAGGSERTDEACDDVESIESLWKQASLRGKVILASRRARPGVVPQSATLPGHVDLDVARLVLSALLSFHKSAENLQDVLRLAPTLEPYTSSKNELLDHIAIYHYLLSVLPLESPVLDLVTPQNIVAVVTRDAGNSWGIWDQALVGRELLAYCLYPAASYFNHSCEPNVTKTRDGRVHEFRAKTHIPAGEELSVSYLGGAEATMGVAQRQRALLHGWYFECQCGKCVEESSDTTESTPDLPTSMEETKADFLRTVEP